METRRSARLLRRREESHLTRLLALAKVHKHLPHWQIGHEPHFLTWRLDRSLPAEAIADLRTTEGLQFFEQDKLLDAASTGPKWLTNPDVANCVTEILIGGQTRGYYELGAWVLMPNHIHLIARPHIELPRMVNLIKRNTAAEANRILNRTGQHFWARDYFDRWVRNRNEEARITKYIEQNPVKAGLCRPPDVWPWSSNDRAERRSSMQTGPTSP